MYLGNSHAECSLLPKNKTSVLFSLHPPAVFLSFQPLWANVSGNNVLWIGNIFVWVSENNNIHIVFLSYFHLFWMFIETLNKMETKQENHYISPLYFFGFQNKTVIFFHHPFAKRIAINHVHQITIKLPSSPKENSATFSKNACPCKYWTWLISWLYLQLRLCAKQPLQGKVLTKQTVSSVGSRPQKIIKSGNGHNWSPLQTHCCSFFFSSSLSFHEGVAVRNHPVSSLPVQPGAFTMLTSHFQLNMARL